MESDKALDPEQIGFLCFIRHASQAYKSPNLVQKTGWLCWYWGRDIHIHSSLNAVFIYSISVVAEVKRLMISGVIRMHSQNARNHMRTDINYLIGLESWNRRGGVISPCWEREWLKRGRITLAVAMVLDSQKAVLLKKMLFS